MIEIKQTPYSSTATFLSSAIATAEYFGFRSIDSFPTNDRALHPLSSSDLERIELSSFARKEERALGSVARKFMSFVRPQHGVYLAWRIGKSGTNQSLNLELHIFGSSSVFADAILIVTTHAILQKAGIDSFTTLVNNMGTSESSGKFVRDVGLFLRKNIETFSPALRTRVESDPIGTLIQLIEKEHPAINRAPQPLEYLNEEERHRLWSFLEYLETLGINYELDGQILGSRDCWAHTLFEISDSHRATLAFGGRYDLLASRYARHSTGAIMVTIPIEVKGSTEIKHRRTPRPQLFYTFIGPEAQKKTLGILNTLHHEGLRVGHELWHPTMHDQMRAAKVSACPYLLIMGHKEALEDSVIVRDVLTNAQDTVPSVDLISYLHTHNMTA